MNQSVRSDITIISKLLRFYFVTISPEFSPLFIPRLDLPNRIYMHSHYTLPPRFHHIQPVRCTLSIIRVFLLTRGSTFQPITHFYPTMPMPLHRPRAICRDFVYNGMCREPHCLRAHVPHNDMVLPSLYVLCFHSLCLLLARSTGLPHGAQ